MDEAFQEQLADWGPFFGYAGTAAATLIGLLFVAVSLRLDIFKSDETADVQHFARLILLTFLIPVTVSGVALMPHDEPLIMAVLILGLGVIGALASIALIREWVRLNPVREPSRGFTPYQWQGWLFFTQAIVAFLALIAAAVLIVRGNFLAFPILGVIEGWMLVYGAVSAWRMLINASQASGSS